MGFFFAVQATQLRDGDFLNTALAELHHVIGTVLASIGGKFHRVYANSGFGPSKPKVIGSVAALFVNFILNDDFGTCCIKGNMRKLDCDVKFACGRPLQSRKRNDPLRDRFLSLKLLLGLVNNVWARSICSKNLCLS